MIVIFPTLGLLLNFVGAWVVFALDVMKASASDSKALNHTFLVWEYLILANTVAINVYMTFFINLK